MMNLLRDDAKSIQYEAFHVFKVFVANPNRPLAVTSILEANKEKLMHFCRKNFSTRREIRTTRSSRRRDRH